MLGRMGYYAIMYNTSFDEVFKRIFSFPSMSTSNYTFAVIAIIYIYIYSNKEFITLRATQFGSILFLISTLLSQSRGGLMALAGVICFISIGKIISFSQGSFKKLRKEICISVL